MKLRQLVDWVWKTRIQNTLGKARQRNKKAREWNKNLTPEELPIKRRHVQTKAVITIIERRGPKLRPRDNAVRSHVVERMITAGYRFGSVLAFGNEKVKVRVTVSPLSRVRQIAS